MFTDYFLTPLESAVESFYREKGIENPADLNIENVAKLFDVHLFIIEDGIEEAIWDDDKIAIFIKSAPLPIMRSVFFHELSHPLFHSGNQLDLSDSFNEMQESQANHFEAYASMPYYMIQQLEIPQQYEEFIDLLVHTFLVTPHKAKKRVDQIRRRQYQATTDKNIIKVKRTKYLPHKPKSWSDETKSIMNQLYEQIGERT